MVAIFPSQILNISNIYLQMYNLHFMENVNSPLTKQMENKTNLILKMFVKKFYCVNASLCSVCFRPWTVSVPLQYFEQ